MSEMVLQATHIRKQFNQAQEGSLVLQDLSLTVRAGEQVAIVGVSGSGKSTLLHLLGGLDKPTQGEIMLSGRNIARMKGAELAGFRNRQVGFVYQFHHLLSEFTALENVSVPLWIQNVPHREAADQARQVLDSVGLGHRLHHRPGELSGGERQRAAIARALITKPALLLTDEPTGNLDRQTAQKVFQVMQELTQKQGSAWIMASHDLELVGRMDTCYRLQEGHLQPMDKLG